MTTTAPIARSDGRTVAAARTIEVLLPPRPAEVRRLRTRVAFDLLPGLESPVVDDVLLVVSELASNAVAASPADEHVRVSVTATHSAVLVVVENRARLDMRSLSFELPPPDHLSGRGLAVVQSLTSEFDLSSRLGRTRARAVISLGR